MKCQYCGFCESKVLDSRPTVDYIKIRRRRECLNCGKRFTTYESTETEPLSVIKKNGSREAFDRGKILAGMLRACEKRPISIEFLESVVDDIEQSIVSMEIHEISTVKIGELVLERLRNLDQVAYIRFASVYREFTDVESFLNELKALSAQSEH